MNCNKKEDFYPTKYYCCYGPTGPIGPTGPTGPTGPSSTLANSTLCFCQAQLAHVIEQLMEKYSGNTFTVYTNSWFNVVGVPSALYQSPEGNGPGIFILTDDTGNFASVTLNTITAITVGSGTIYDSTITYLAPTLPLSPGCDTDVVTAIHDYLPISSDVLNIYSEILLESTGNVIKNEYGMLVLQSSTDNHPIFIAPLHIVISETISAEKKVKESELVNYYKNDNLK